MIWWLFHAAVLLSTLRSMSSERIIIYPIEGQAGLTDRFTILGSFLNLAVAMNATLSFPRPCDSLSHKHSKQIADCEHGWNYYAESTVSFFGYANTIEKPPCHHARLLTGQVLDSIKDAPRGNFCYVFTAYFWDTRQQIENCIQRLAAKRHLRFPLVSVIYSPKITDLAKQLLQQLHLIEGKFGVMKIRRMDRYENVNCTSPEAVIRKFHEVHSKLTLEEQTYPWIVFGYVEPGYWELLAESLFLSPLFPRAPKLLFERDLHFHHTPIHKYFEDNYILAGMIGHIFHHAKYSISSYHYEGKDHFCKA